MKITNNSGLPQPFVDMATKEYEYKPKRYGVTTLLKSVRQNLLQRRHDEEIEQDCADMIWALFGQAVHKVLETSNEKDELFKEEKLTYTLENGYTISGILDLYDLALEEVSDYKTASVWKVIYGDYTDWRLQGLAYAWLLKKCGLNCRRVKFYAILKDWSKTDSTRKADYPKQPVAQIVFDVTEVGLQEIEKMLLEKIEEIRNCEELPDEELPMCSDADRWYTGDKFAVMKNGRKTALRVCDTELEAREWRENNGGDYIEKRVGVDRKCQDYCTCCKFCDYWKLNYEKKDEE